MPSGFDVEGEDVRMGVDVGAHLLERLVDHEVDDLYEPVRQGAHERRADRRLGAQAAVPYVDVDRIDAGLIKSRELVAQAQKIGGQHSDAETRTVVDQLSRRGLHQAGTTVRESSWKSS